MKATNQFLNGDGIPLFEYEAVSAYNSPISPRKDLEISTVKEPKITKDTPGCAPGHCLCKSMTPAGRNTDFLDGIRALGIFLVVAAHTGLNDMWEVCGGTGVDIFLCLSGFLMVLSFYPQLSKTKLKPLRFAKITLIFWFKRLLRIYGPLLIWIYIQFVFIGQETGPFRLCNWNTNTEMFESIVGMRPMSCPVWYIPIQVGHYFIMPFYVVFVHLSGKYWKLVVLIALGLSIYHDLTCSRGFQIQFDHLGTLFTSASFGIIYLKSKSYLSSLSNLKGTARLLLSYLEGFAVLMMVSTASRLMLFKYFHKFHEPNQRGYISIYLCAIFLKEAYIPGTIAKFFSKKSFKWIATISYTIYLMHFWVVYNRPEFPGYTYDKVTSVIACWFFTLFVGWVCYHAIERPYNWCTNFFCDLINVNGPAKKEEALVIVRNFKLMVIELVTYLIGLIGIGSPSTEILPSRRRTKQYHRIDVHAD